MSEPTANETPFVLWVMGAFVTLLYAVVYHIFNLINKSNEDSDKAALEVKAELLRYQADQSTRYEVMRQEQNARWQEGREDRDALRQLIQRNHEIDTEQHQQLLMQMADLPNRINKVISRRQEPEHGND